jgi:hypothetical protein
MNLNLIMRYTYSLAWALAALAIIYRALLYLRLPLNLPVSSRGVFFASGFLFLACIATKETLIKFSAFHNDSG